MWMSNLPAFLPFFIAAALIAFVPQRARQVLMVLVPVWGGLNLWFGIENNSSINLLWMGYELTPFRVDQLSLVFGSLFHLAALIGFVFMLNVKDRMQQISSMVYAGSAVGATFAGDLLTLFLFWEGLALSSVFLIWAQRTDHAIRTGMRYLIIQVTSGLLLLAGAIMHYDDTGSLAFEFIGLESMASWLIFLAFGIKCAFPFLHNWLTDAYPESTPAGAVFLSAFTTKVAVYALARGYPGTDLLIYIGAAMASFPIFYAVIENDLRRVLAYSLINQLGFMVVGIGIGTALALNGTVAHAVSHVLYKGLLFMTMGSVLFRVGHVLGSDLGGLYRTMPKTAVLCVIGAASISAFPLFSGFVSKTMVMAASIEEGHHYIWLVLLFASAGVFHHAGIKVPYFAFFAHDSGLRPKEAPANMLFAMAMGAALCLIIGMQPQLLYAILPWDVDYWPYDTTHVLTQLQLLLYSALAFVWLNKMGWYPPELRSVNLDIEWTYRKLLPAMAAFIRSGAGNIYGKLMIPVTMLGWVRLDSQSQGSWMAGRLTERLLVIMAVFIVAGVWLAD